MTRGPCHKMSQGTCNKAPPRHKRQAGPGAWELLFLHHHQTSDEEKSSCRHPCPAAHPAPCRASTTGSAVTAVSSPPSVGSVPTTPCCGTDTRWCPSGSEPCQGCLCCGFPPPPGLTTCFLGLPLGRLPLLRFCTSFSCSLEKKSPKNN